MTQLPQLTMADVVAAERELCRRSFAYFVKRSWHVVEPSTQLKWGWALDAICMHLQAVTEKRIQNLLITVPPGAMKSLLVGVFWPAWEWGPRNLKSMRYLGTAHEQELAIRDSRRCRELIKSDWFQSRWFVALRKDMDGKREFGNTSTGARSARAFTSMTGARADRVLLDDPISAHNANSVAKLEDAKTAFLETLPTRINDPDKSSIVVIMQRLHQDDVAGIILNKGLDYVHLNIPMEFEPDNACETVLGWRDPRTEADELMFPERFSRKAVDELKRTLGSYASAGQLQQRPSPRGGGIIKESWWQYWTVTPKIKWRMIYADTALEAKEEHDYSVFQCWGMCDDGRIALLDQKRGKWESPDLKRHARMFWNKHAAMPGVGALRIMKIEKKASGHGLVQSLKRAENGEPAIPVRGIPRHIDKVSRANNVSPQIEAGNVLLPQEAPWLDDYIDEFNTFPAGSFDDQCDPTFDAIEDMLGRTVQSVAGVGKPAGSIGPSVVGG